MGELSHLDEKGQARMVDIRGKQTALRTASASARVRTRPDVIEMIASGQAAKGDVLAVARVAGIMAAKRTSEWLPLCHPITLDGVEIDIELGRDLVQIRVTCATTGRTGVEMEALTAAAAAALTVYDMLKAVDRAMVIEHVQLEEKSGGRSGTFIRGQG